MKTPSMSGPDTTKNAAALSEPVPAEKDKPLYSAMAAKPPTRIFGTGTNKSGLKVSTRPRQIYIGCLDPDTQVVNVIDYVRKNIGIQVPCEQLKTRGNTYT